MAGIATILVYWTHSCFRFSFACYSSFSGFFFLSCLRSEIRKRRGRSKRENGKDETNKQRLFNQGQFMTQWAVMSKLKRNITKKK